MGHLDKNNHQLSPPRVYDDNTPYRQIAKLNASIEIFVTQYHDPFACHMTTVATLYEAGSPVFCAEAPSDTAGHVFAP